jgi:FtsP/CotA-like multicopper oxidase with cupredoxin domain
VGLRPFPSGDAIDRLEGQVMQFKVDLPFSGTDKSWNPEASHPALRAAPMVDVKPADSGKQPDVLRQLTVVESPGTDGPLESLINNTKWSGDRVGTDQPVPGSISNGRGVSATETPREGSTEVWEIANLTEDAHPLHIHLIQAQVISRQQFAAESYKDDWARDFPGQQIIYGYGPPLPYSTPNEAGALGGNRSFAGYTLSDATPPDPIDAGWKDTIKLFPGQITRIALRWAPQRVPAGGVAPGQNAFPFDPTTNGAGYVNHCHILDHEDNEFMRTMLITR